MLPHPHRVDIFKAHQPQQGGDGARNLFTQQFAVFLPGNLWRFEGGENANGQPGIGPWGVDGKLGALLEPLEAFWGDAPFSQTVAPENGSCLCRLRHCFTFTSGLVGVDPRLKIGRGQVREMHQGIGNVPLGIDHNGWDVVQCRFFQQIEAKAGLARASHAHNHSMGHQII